jgi:hypothetical protein
MLDAIALYLEYWSSCVVSLRIVMTDLNLLFCISRKDKVDRDLTRNAVFLWNNIVLCAKVERSSARNFDQSIAEEIKQVNARTFKWSSTKRFNFDLLNYHAVSCAILESIDDLFSLYEFALWLVNQITVWNDDSFLCIDESSKESWF